MRRVALTVSALLVASLLPVTGAAADSTVVVRGLNGFPDEADFSWVGCTDLFERAFEPLPLFYIGDDAPPLGEAYFGAVVQLDQAIGALLSVDHLATTSVASMKFDSEGDASGVAYVLYEPDGTSDGTFWVGRASLGAEDTGWQEVDVAGLTYVWKKRDPAANQGGGAYVADGGTDTIADFVADHGLDGDATFTIGFGCNGNKVWFDAFRVGSPGNVTTYDLEREQSETTISPSASVVTAGSSVKLTGVARPVGQTNVYANAALYLEARPAGSADFAEVGEATIDPDSKTASLVVKPSVATEYRWRFNGGPSIEPSLSPVVKIQVRTAVTAAIADKTLKPGRRLVVTGRTTPKKPGVAATLWRKTATGRVKLSTTTIKADGTYRLTKVLKKKGVWKVFVTVPASSGNLAGTSPVRKARVR